MKKKLIALILAAGMMLSACPVFAATNSTSGSTVVKPSTTTVSNFKVTVSNKTYTGKFQTPSFKVTATVTVDGKPVNVTLTEGKDYTVVVHKHKNTGSYYYKVIGKGIYKDTIKAKWSIKKAKNTVKASIKKRKITAKAKSGKVSYKVYFKGKATKNVSVKNGRIVVKKAAKKGTYTVKVSSKTTKNYKATSKKLKVTVK